MASTLLLMRHGKARNLAEGQQDFDRELSEAGTRALKANIVKQVSLVEKAYAPLQIWSSPAIRAMQTAEILVDALRKVGVKAEGGIVEKDSIWVQDTSALLDELAACEAKAVFVVGHNPMIEDLAETLAGARIPFATGGIAALGLSGQGEWTKTPSDELGDEPPCRLLWFTQGPVSQRWRTLVFMEKTLRTASRNVRERKKAFFECPEDVETMHKFRVSIRTFRSLLAFVKPWQDGKQNAEMQADLKEVVAATSRLRELDVLAEKARGARVTSEGLVAFCEAEASAERERVMQVLADKQTEKRLERVSKQVKYIRWKRRYCKEGLDAAEIRARFDDMASKLEHAVSVLDLAEIEPTHDVRKSAKRVRYAAENFKDIIGEDAPSIAKGMTAHQDKLGDVCDARVNIEIINGLQDREDIPEPVAWELALLRAESETFLYTTLRERQE